MWLCVLGSAGLVNHVTIDRVISRKRHQMSECVNL